MGKKVKKDDKGPPEDVFEALLIESRQAATVVLMLDSPEDEVQAKACEAIYHFVDKCDENKKLLLDLGSLDPLLRLMSQSEEKSIRRNAVMAVGVMSGAAEVRAALRKTDGAVSTVIRLLGPEEFVTTHEFASMCLAHLAQEFTSMSLILENGGLESIVDCLRSEDPDVQKNSVEFVALMMQDFEARAIIKDVGGLEAILDLLKSEFSAIQKLALTALIRATQDLVNRVALRELDALRLFVEIVGRPELNDLHVLALHVIANCADDVDSLQQLKETGGLLRLVAFITDVTPPEEEAKGEKGKKPKSASKKKKGDDDGKGGKEDDSRPSHTLPEVKMHCAQAIGRAAKNADNRRILHEAEVEKMLITLLSHDDAAVKSAAANGLATMSESAISQDSITKWEGIDPLIKMLKMDSKECKESSALALANLTHSNMTNCGEVAAHHGIEPLIPLLGHDNERVVANALAALTNMSSDDYLRSKVLSHGLINALRDPLNFRSSLVLKHAAYATAGFISDTEARNEYRESGCLESLMKLLHSNHDEVRRAACWAIKILAADGDAARDICKLGGLQTLQLINLSTSRKSRFSETAMLKLLDTNLSAKYALTGKLDFTDRIGDEFYDPGQLREDANLMSLEEYYKQPLNAKRPVLLINTRKPVAPTPSQQTPIDSDRQTDTKPSSDRSVKRKSLTGSAAKKPEEIAGSGPPGSVAGESVVDDTLDAGFTAFAPHYDATLVAFVDYVTAEVVPLASTREQVVQLACFVAEKMGGCIERGQVMNFNFELPISELKYILKTNVIPIGEIRNGIFYHRALLFKFLADKAGLSVNLIRGDYNRAWNEIWLSDTLAETNVRLAPSRHIVDLMHEPGSLLRCDSVEASIYVRL